MLPSTTYDFATGPLVDLDIQNPKSIQISRLVSTSITQKRVGIVGLWLNKCPNVHINDSVSASSPLRLTRQPLACHD